MSQAKVELQILVALEKAPFRVRLTISLARCHKLPKVPCCTKIELNKVTVYGF